MYMYIKRGTHAYYEHICLSGDCRPALNINSSSSNVLALKGDGRWKPHKFIACYAKNTPTGN